MKKLAFMFPALGALSALAEGGTTGSGTAYAGSVAETLVTQSQGTLTNFLAGAATPIATVIGAGLAIWGGIALVGILKKAFSVGKGR